MYYGGSYLDLWLAKFNPSGDTLWTRTLDFDVIDIGYRLALDPSGDIATTAYVGDGVDFDCVTLKLSPDGDTLWTRRYDRGIDDAGASVAIDPNGNIIVAGRTVKDVSSDALVLKYDSSGVLVWDRAFDLDLDDGAGGAACDSAGNVYVAGYTGAYGVYDCLVMKLDSTGNLLWTATYGGSGDDQATDAACDDIGDPIISGVTGDGSADLLIAKYSPFTGVAESPRSDAVPVLTRSAITAAPDFVLSVPCSGRYDIRLSDLCGRPQRRVFSGRLNEGAHRFSLAGQRAGHYFVRVSAPDGGVSCQRLVLVK